MEQRLEFSLTKFAERNLPRLLADGVEYNDYVKVLSKSKTMSEWCSDWAEIAMFHQRMGEEEAAKGHGLTARDAFWRASIYNHFGQFKEFHNLPLKNEIFRRKVDTYSRATALFDPPSQRIEIPFENITMPAYFRIPKHAL